MQPVQQAPTLSAIQNLIVGNAVSASHGLRWVNELSFLEAACLPVVTSQRFKVPTGASASVKIPYARSVGAMALMVHVELHQATASPVGACTITVTDSSAKLAWIVANALDGSGTIRVMHGTRLDYGYTRAWADVSAMTVGSTVDIEFAWANTSNTQGIYSITLAEVPLSVVDPTSAPTTEPSAEAAWPTAGGSLNLLIDGTTTYRRGFARLFSQIDSARTLVRRHYACISTWENTTDAWQVTSAAVVAIPMGMGTNPTFRIRPRCLYGTASGANTCTLRVRYRTSGANTGTLRCAVTPVGGAAANTNLALAASAGAWTSATIAITLPSSGTSGEVDIQYLASTTAGTLYVSSLSIIESES